MLRPLLLWGAMLLSSACHTLKFDVGSGPVERVVYERKAFYLGGLSPTVKVDVSQHCPNGAVAIREETTFVDGLLSFVTLSIYTPRSSWYYCAREEASS